MGSPYTGKSCKLLLIEISVIYLCLINVLIGDILVYFCVKYEIKC